MTESNNGWPSRPGVPLHPERDGWHWVGGTVQPSGWDADCQEWLSASGGWIKPADLAHHRYIGPCLTPTEHAAALADARAQAFEEAARECEAAQDDRERDAALEARRSAYNQYPYAEMGEEAGRLAAAIRALAAQERGA